MLALEIILGIIAFFVIVLSIRVRVMVHSEDGIDLTVKWLFLKFKILPRPKKDKKKPKKPKKKKKKKEKPEEEKKDETVKEPKEKKENIFVRFYHNNGVSGVVELLKRAAEALGGMFKRIGRAFVFDEINISLLVGAGDSAETAIKYGKTCSAAYPAMGLIVDTMRVKKYNLEISPDFIKGSNNARLHVRVSVRPIRLINAFVVLGVQMLFKVVIKFLRGAKKKKAEPKKEEINKVNN